MPIIIEFNSPAKKDYETIHVAVGTKLKEWFLEHRPAQDFFTRFEDAAAPDDLVLAEKDVVAIWPKYKGTGAEIALWAMVAVSFVASVYTYTQMPDASAGDSRQASSVYNYNSQGNKARLNNPAVVQLGRMPYYPDVITAPWYEYVGNVQYYYQQFSRGVGKFENHGRYIGETDISNYGSDIELNVYQPGEVVNAFHHIVWSSPEVGAADGQGGLELDAPVGRFEATSFAGAITGSGLKGEKYGADVDHVGFKGDQVYLRSSWLWDFARFPWAVGDVFIIANSNDNSLVYEGNLDFIDGGDDGDPIDPQPLPDIIRCLPGWPSRAGVGTKIVVEGGSQNDSIYIVESITGTDVTVKNEAGSIVKDLAPLTNVFCRVYISGGFDGAYKVLSINSDNWAKVSKVDAATLVPVPGWTAFFSGSGYENRFSVVLYSHESISQEALWTSDFNTLPQVWSGRSAEDVGFDVLFPAGLYESRDNGQLGNRTVEIEARFRERGSVSGYHVLTKSWTRDDATPYRQTIWLSDHASFDRTKHYEISFRRVTARTESIRVSDRVQVSGLKSKLQKDYVNEEETIITLKIKATDALSSEANAKFWTDDTRILPVLQDDGVTFIEQPTVSPMDAFIYLNTDTVTGAGLDLADVDVATALQYRPILAARGDECNGIFDSAVGFWDALKTVLTSCRCKPRLEFDNTVSFWRDEERAALGQPYTPINTMPNSFTADVKTHEEDAYDGVELEWFNPITRAPEKAVCTLPHQDGYNLKPVKSKFITNEAQALREGLFIAAVDAYRKTTIKMTSDVTAFESNYGDVVPVAHDAMAWGSFGEVIEWDATSKLLRLSGYHDAQDGLQNYITFNAGITGNHGPYRVEPTEDAEVWLLIDELQAGKNIYPVGARGVPRHSHYTFGVGQVQHKNCIIEQASQSGEDAVSLKMFEDDPRVHDYA